MNLISILTQSSLNRKLATNRGLAKVAAQCSADTFVVNQSLILRINICGENRHLRPKTLYATAEPKKNTVEIRTK
jgi:hypothetical protein